MVRNSYKVARRLLEEALAIYRERGDTPKMAYTRKALAQVAIAQCDYTRAHTLLEEHLAFFRARGDQYKAAYPLYSLACAPFLPPADRAAANALAAETL